ncbi:PAS domain-containing protein [Salibacterium salarium]|uniref:PAS domain-containing protein n=1 Tax=Salibacterium salarium TaxID=284579 RepID=A0A3R9WQY0_9BACI|nr:STAS domain-containing protein [Salibacterium salarium]RSL31695.1 PAS domain-containing protein [Salibacterium salarium]
MFNPITHPPSTDLLIKAMDSTRAGVIITDPDQKDNPIIYANQGFVQLTGYQSNEIIGLNCRFLQGKDTDTETVGNIRHAINHYTSLSTEVINYRKDGSFFWNELHIDPIYIEDENKHYFIGIQKDITKQIQAEEKAHAYNKEIHLMSAPIIPIVDNIFALPVIGNVDEERLKIIFDHTTEMVYSSNVETLILDLSGLGNLNDEVIKGLFTLNSLMKILGAELIITGVSPAIAEKSQSSGVNLNDLQTYATIKQAVKAKQHQN